MGDLGADGRIRRRVRTPGVAGESSGFDRPATFSCHFLGVAEFGPVDLRVETRKSGKTAASQRGPRRARAIARSSTPRCGASATSRGSSTTRRSLPMCRIPMFFRSSTSCCPTTRRPCSPSGTTSRRSRSNSRPSGRRTVRCPAEWREWLRFAPTATFDDPWADAARSVILVDLPSWPAAHRPHAWKQPPFIAPTLDLHVGLHRADCGQGLAAVRGHRAAFHGRPVRLDVTRVVARRRAARIGRRAMSVPPYAAVMHCIGGGQHLGPYGDGGTSESTGPRRLAWLPRLAAGHGNVIEP